VRDVPYKAALNVILYKLVLSVMKKINTLIKEIERTPFEGSGKPEPLKHNLSGWWSRRINLEHRLVYKIENDTVIISQCRFHY
jgi:toxin YoeB